MTTTEDFVASDEHADNGHDTGHDTGYSYRDAPPKARRGRPSGATQRAGSPGLELTPDSARRLAAELDTRAGELDDEGADLLQRERVEFLRGVARAARGLHAAG